MTSSEKKQVKKRATQIHNDVAQQGSIHFLSGVADQAYKMMLETASKNPAYAAYLKTKEGKAKLAEVKAHQDNLAKLDPAYAQRLREQRARQRG